MQNYCGNSNEYMRRGNPGRNSQITGCQRMGSTPSCVCEPKKVVEAEDIFAGLPIAMAYVPWQTWKCIMNMEKALRSGTIFEELDKPFCGKGGMH